MYGIRRWQGGAARAGSHHARRPAFLLELMTVAPSRCSADLPIVAWCTENAGRRFDRCPTVASSSRSRQPCGAFQPPARRACLRHASSRHLHAGSSASAELDPLLRRLVAHRGLAAFELLRDTFHRLLAGPCPSLMASASAAGQRERPTVHDHRGLMTTTGISRVVRFW